MEFTVDKNLYSGRPQNEGCRLSKEISCYDFLDSLHVSYGRVDHSPADTIEDCRQVEKIIGVGICKNLFLCNRQQTNFYLLLMSGEKPFRTKHFSKQLGVSRLSFAPPEFMEKYLDITPGSVSILGLKNDKDLNVQLCIDEDVIKAEYIRCHPCINTSTLKIKTADVLNTILPAMKHTPIIVNLPFEYDE